MGTLSKSGAIAPAANSGADIADWRPEDDTFWESTGKKIAYRNLWLSIPALLCGFAVWGMWGIITVQMLNLGFPFTQAELFTLTAIAGISGATMRIPASFLVRLAGGRNTIFLTTAMLLAPALGTGIVLQHKDWPLWAFQLMALWCGVGGGNFASSMSNISTFFPKRLQGTALGLNAGLGNFGVTTMQIVIPLVMTVGLLGSFGGEPMTLVKDSGWILGRITAGTPTWIQNAGFAWVLSLVPLAMLCWFGMKNLKTVSPAIGTPAGSPPKLPKMPNVMTRGITICMVVTPKLPRPAFNPSAMPCSRFGKKVLMFDIELAKLPPPTPHHSAIN